jgi:hypothetical protein
MRKNTLIILIVSMVISGCAGFLPVMATETALIPEPEIPARATMIEAATAIAAQAPEGWLTYDNDAYGFYFHYPPQYEVLTDETNLYGWENGIVLLYNGGQSYDIAVQVWESAEEMGAFYGGEDERLHVYPVGVQIISVMNITNEAESDAIIESFTIY